MAAYTGNDSTRILARDVPNILPTLPMVSVVVFPFNVASFAVLKKQNIELVRALPASEQIVCLATQRDEEREFPESEKDVYEIGVAGRLIHRMNLPDQTLQVALQGLSRVRIKRFTTLTPFAQAEVSPARTIGGSDKSKEMNQLIQKALNRFEALISLDQRYSAELLNVLRMNIKGPGRFADLLATYIAWSVSVRAEILGELNCRKRLKLVIKRIEEEVARLAVDSEMRTRTQITLDEAQREYFLRQQLKAIRTELGETKGTEAEVTRLHDRLEASGMPEPVAKECGSEIDRLALISEGSAEYNVIFTHIDWLLKMPWDKTTEDNLDLVAVRAILDEDHFGLEKVKDRIIEFLAVMKLKKELKGPILCLVGPPGVGKTSLGRSVARAMGRKFERFSVGGLHDDAEIMGHRRTYVGAMPGRIVHALKKAGTSNPIVMIDEIDKMGADSRGDPSAAMLEVLDPEQNRAFTDRYLDVPVDLSRVLFLCTANMLDTIPAPLRDRMEVIELSGYTLEEKIEISRRYIVPRQLDAAGLKRSQLSFHKAAIAEIARGYTREAGLRNFERRIAAICRKVATRAARGRLKRGEKVTVTADDVASYLGQRIWAPDEAARDPEVGVATGLAWTAMGGDTLLIETTKYPGKGRVRITGSLGDVMKESVETAMSYVRSNAGAYGVEDTAFTDFDTHLHFPEGAVPKDGPSAGVTIVTALVSLYTGVPVRGDIAMTGEVSLRGKVLAVGGIKEKVLAAYRSGIRQVLLPKGNEKDLKEIPKAARKSLKITFTSDVRENVRSALVGPRKSKRRKKSKSAPPRSRAAARGKD